MGLIDLNVDERHSEMCLILVDLLIPFQIALVFSSIVLYDETGHVFS